MDFITDRTAEDVMLGNAKGRYASADLNRVEGNTAAIAVIAQQMGHSIALTTKTDWGAPSAFDPDEWPVESQMLRYLGNVRSLCALVGAPDTNLPESMDGLDYTGANAIEAALQTAHNYLQRAQRAWRYSGELYAGEETGL